MPRKADFMPEKSRYPLTLCPISTGTRAPICPIVRMTKVGFVIRMFRTRPGRRCLLAVLGLSAASTPCSGSRIAADSPEAFCSSFPTSVRFPAPLSPAWARVPGRWSRACWRLSPGSSAGEGARADPPVQGQPGLAGRGDGPVSGDALALRLTGAGTGDTIESRRACLASVIEDEGPADGLTLDAAIEQMLEANLDVLALKYEIPQADADILTAGLRTNPLIYIDDQFIPYGAFTNQGPADQRNTTSTLPTRSTSPTSGRRGSGWLARPSRCWRPSFRT